MLAWQNIAQTQTQMVKTTARRLNWACAYCTIVVWPWCSAACMLSRISRCHDLQMQLYGRHMHVYHCLINWHTSSFKSVSRVECAGCMYSWTCRKNWSSAERFNAQMMRLCLGECTSQQPADFHALGHFAASSTMMLAMWGCITAAVTITLVLGIRIWVAMSVTSGDLCYRTV